MVEEIRAMGGIASANYDDVSDWAGAENMIKQTVEEFGDINVLICVSAAAPFVPSSDACEAASRGCCWLHRTPASCATARCST